MARDRCSSLKSSFLISAYFARNKRFGSARSFVQKVNGRVGRARFSIKQGLEIVTNFDEKKYANVFNITKSDDLKGWPKGWKVVRVELQNGIAVEYDGIKTVRIHASNENQGTLCGLCGDSDGVMTSADFMRGFHVQSGLGNSPHKCPPKLFPGKAGSIAKTHKEFVSSWFYSKDISDDHCMEECTDR